MEADFPKTCTMCALCWSSPETLALDEEIEVTGYQAAFGAAEEGLVLLTHARPDCGTTMAVLAGSLRSLYNGPLHHELMAGTAQCAGLCLEQGLLEECEAPCSMAWVRTVLQHLRAHELPAGQQEGAA